MNVINMNIFSPEIFKICCGCSLAVSFRGKFWLRNKKNNYFKYTLLLRSDEVQFLIFLAIRHSLPVLIRHT